MWAAENKKLIDQHCEELGGGIGARQQAKAHLFRALSADEQASWAAKAQEAKSKRMTDPNAYLLYVSQTDRV